VGPRLIRCFSGRRGCVSAATGGTNDEASARMPWTASIEMSADIGPAQLARIEHAGAEVFACPAPWCIGQTAPSAASMWWPAGEAGDSWHSVSALAGWCAAQQSAGIKAKSHADCITSDAAAHMRRRRRRHFIRCAQLIGWRRLMATGRPKRGASCATRTPGRAGRRGNERSIAKRHPLIYRRDAQNSHRRCSSNRPVYCSDASISQHARWHR
jgi:hypothetical protein